MVSYGCVVCILCGLVQVCPCKAFFTCFFLLNVFMLYSVGTVWHCNNLCGQEGAGYSRTSIARTPMARLQWVIRIHFLVPKKFFR